MIWYLEILSFIAKFDLKGNAINILGVFWVLALMIVAFKSFKTQLPHYLLEPKAQRKVTLTFSVLAISFVYIFLMQQCLDDLLTIPIQLLFGSWRMVETQLGSLTLFALLDYRWEIYISIITISIVFSYYGFWKLFHFTKESAFWLSATIIFQIFLASQHNFNFRELQGYDRMVAYWVSYPEFRILSGFFVASTFKKKIMEKNITPLWRLRCG